MADPVAEDLQVAEPRPTAGAFAAERSAAEPFLPRPSVLSHSVIRQLLPAVSLNLAERPVELSLDPAELGRVRLTLSQAEGVMTLLIQAERPETLDLMRRGSEHLAAEFSALGYSGLDLSFARDDRPPPGVAEDAQPTDDAPPPADDPRRLRVSLNAGYDRMTDGRIDLRI